MGENSSTLVNLVSMYVYAKAGQNGRCRHLIQLQLKFVDINVYYDRFNPVDQMRPHMVKTWTYPFLPKLQHKFYRVAKQPKN
jgi:hypothetical protein